jgi:hypothetical protein
VTAPPAPLHRLAALLLATLVLVGARAVAARSEPSLADLRRALLEAHGDDAVGRALDALQARVGQVDGLPDLGAFGDWLGALPDGRAAEPRALRRGWVHVSAKRGEDAWAAGDRAQGRSQPGRCAPTWRGAAPGRRLEDALAMLATALKAGYAAPHLHESALEAVLGLRRDRPVREAEGLPAYAQAAVPFLLVVEDDALHATLARALLDDLAAYDKPDSARGLLWARAAGEHAWHVLARTDQVQGGARLALDAALVLTSADGAAEGRTPRFDLLARAYVLGKPSDREGHDLPEVLPLLAEAALAEGRYELAHRLARERLELSESPAARRVLLKLPPDVGD